MPASFSGTPLITLVSPAKAAAINHFDIWINNSHALAQRLVDPGVDPMFYPTAQISAVAPIYDDGVVIAQLYGQGFRPAGDHKLWVSGQSLDEVKVNRRLRAGEFRVEDGSYIQAVFDRRSKYPKWNIDYMERISEVAQHASIAREDDGPPMAVKCAKISKEKEDDKTLRVEATGTLLPIAYPPVSGDTANFTITSITSSDSYSKWVILGTPGKSLQNATIVFKGALAANPSYFFLSQCTGFKQVAAPPKPAPKAKTVEAGKAGDKTPPAKKGETVIRQQTPH
jgi:hypothetical protein